MRRMGWTDYLGMGAGAFFLGVLLLGINVGILPLVAAGLAFAFAVGDF